MKKVYSSPAVEVYEAQATQMIAESLVISDKTVDGSEALSREDAAWDIWNNE